MESFPDPFAAEREVLHSSTLLERTHLLGQKAVDQVSIPFLWGAAPDLTIYLLDLGMDHEAIIKLVHNFPTFANYNVDRKVKPLVEQLLELGIPRCYIPGILQRWPHLCGVTLPAGLKPMVAYLESIGVNKDWWSKVIYRWPTFLTFSRKKVETTVRFLSELGVAKRNIGKILVRAPQIVGCSVDDKLRPAAEYFQSIGADPAGLMQRSPQAFGLNIKGKLMPITEFFLDRGFSIKEIGTMVNKFGNIHTLRLEDNLLPKYDFFLTMEYPRYDLVKFPQYFGYSLEWWIKLRFTQMADCGVSLSLNHLLSHKDIVFVEMLQKKMDEVRNNCNLR